MALAPAAGHIQSNLCKTAHLVPSKIVVIARCQIREAKQSTGTRPNGHKHCVTVAKELLQSGLTVQQSNFYRHCLSPSIQLYSITTDCHTNAALSTITLPGCLMKCSCPQGCNMLQLALIEGSTFASQICQLQPLHADWLCRLDRLPITTRHI